MRAGQGSSGDPARLQIRCRPGLHCSLRQLNRLSLNEGVVHELERLQRCGRHASPWCFHRRIWAIKRVEQRILAAVHIDSINGSTIELRFLAIHQRVEGGVKLRSRERAEAGSANRWVQLTTGCEHCVAHRFSLQSSRRKSPKEPVVRIDRCRRGIESRRLAIGGRLDNQLVQCLDPFVLLQPHQ